MKRSIVVSQLTRSVVLIAALALSACDDKAEVCSYYQQRIKAYDECFATAGCRSEADDHYQHDRILDYMTNMHCPVVNKQ